MNPLSQFDSAAIDRREASAELTFRLESKKSFSFLRLGDGELRFLLQVQEGQDPIRPSRRTSGQIPIGGPGLRKRHYGRLLRSLECCSCLDPYLHVPFNIEHLQKLKWNRTRGTTEDMQPGMYGIIFDWIYYEAREYFLRHSCLVCGAEAALLRELLKEEEYRIAADEFFDAEGLPLFAQPRNNGARLSDDLDAIKEDLRQLIAQRQIDTILLSLGGAAKILCYELAQEMGIRALDIGASLRGLTYSGSVGYAPNRSNHHVQMLTVSFPVYMRALHRAHPLMTGVELAARAHAQLCFELQHKEPLKAIACDLNQGGRIDRSIENRTRFWAAHRYYRRNILPMLPGDEGTAKLVREFRLWRWREGLGWDGGLVLFGIRAKDWLRRVTKKVLSAWRGSISVAMDSGR